MPFGFRGGLGGRVPGRRRTSSAIRSSSARTSGLDVVNATCPGETTASFLDATAQSNGCENSLQGRSGFRSHFPLHVAYDSPQQSQLDYALQTLRKTDDVRLVTLQIGANDAFLCQQTTPDHCASPAELQAARADGADQPRPAS